jgi:hypothetical protein
MIILGTRSFQSQQLKCCQAIMFFDIRSQSAAAPSDTLQPDAACDSNLTDHFVGSML